MGDISGERVPLAGDVQFHRHCQQSFGRRLPSSPDCEDWLCGLVQGYKWFMGSRRRRGPEPADWDGVDAYGDVDDPWEDVSDEAW